MAAMARRARRPHATQYREQSVRHRRYSQAESALSTALFAMRGNSQKCISWSPNERRSPSVCAFLVRHIPIPIYLHNVTLNGVFLRLAALFVVAIARYDASSRLASRKNPSISLLRYEGRLVSDRSRS